MGTIKIELDLPDFKEELEINIVIRKDGEIVTKVGGSGSSFPAISTPSTKPATDSDIAESTVDRKTAPKPRKKSTGNLMGADLF